MDIPLGAGVGLPKALDRTAQLTQHHEPGKESTISERCPGTLKLFAIEIFMAHNFGPAELFPPATRHPGKKPFWKDGGTLPWPTTPQSRYVKRTPKDLQVLKALCFSHSLKAQ